MPAGYQECPDRDPPPTTWGVVLDLALLAGLLKAIAMCAI
jgi:hypothetical protein